MPSTEPLYYLTSVIPEWEEANFSLLTTEEELKKEKKKKEKKPILKGKKKKEKKIDDKHFPCFKCKKRFDKKEELTHIEYSYGIDKKRNHHVCEKCLEKYYFKCCNCNKTYLIGDIRKKQSTSNLQIYCSTCYREIFTSCDDCGCEVLRREAEVVYDDEDDDEYTYCQNCYNSYRERTRESSRWNNPITFQKSKTFKENESKRYIGVEIEAERKAKSTIEILKKDCFDYTCCKHDGSLSNGDEITLNPTNGDLLYKRIREVCKGLQEGNYIASKRCGLHIHIDTRGLTKEQIRNIFLCYGIFERYFFEMVEPARRTNQYCYPVEGKLDLNKIMSNFIEYVTCQTEHDRYYWANVTRAFEGRNSLEIRLHQGTLNPEEIIKWIKIHLRLFEWALNSDVKRVINLKNSVKSFFNIINDKKLINYIKHKRTQYKKEKIPRTKIINVKEKLEKDVKIEETIRKFYWNPEYVIKDFYDIILNLKNACLKDTKNRKTTKTYYIGNVDKLKYLRCEDGYSAVCIDKFDDIFRYLVRSMGGYLNKTLENYTYRNKISNPQKNDLSRFVSYLKRNTKGLKRVFGDEVKRINKEINEVQDNKKIKDLFITANKYKYAFSRINEKDDKSYGKFDTKYIMSYMISRIRNNMWSNNYEKRVKKYYNENKGRKSTKCVKYK